MHSLNEALKGAKRVISVDESEREMCTRLAQDPRCPRNSSIGIIGALWSENVSDLLDAVQLLRRMGSD